MNRYSANVSSWKISGTVVNDANYAYDLLLLAKKLTQAESLLQAAEIYVV